MFAASQAWPWSHIRGILWGLGWGGPRGGRGLDIDFSPLAGSQAWWTPLSPEGLWLWRSRGETQVTPLSLQFARGGFRANNGPLCLVSPAAGSPGAWPTDESGRTSPRPARPWRPRISARPERADDLIGRPGEALSLDSPGKLAAHSRPRVQVPWP